MVAGFGRLIVRRIPPCLCSIDDGAEPIPSSQAREYRKPEVRTSRHRPSTNGRFCLTDTLAFAIRPRPWRDRVTEQSDRVPHRLSRGQCILIHGRCTLQYSKTVDVASALPSWRVFQPGDSSRRESFLCEHSCAAWLHFCLAEPLTHHMECPLVAGWSIDPTLDRQLAAASTPQVDLSFCPIRLH